MLLSDNHIFVFNYQKSYGMLSLVTDGTPSVNIPQSAISKMDNLDPTFVKAFAMQESRAGTDKRGISTLRDIMQVNNGATNFQDYDPHLASYGINSRTHIPNPKESIYAGIRELATKGFHGQTGSYNFTGWYQALEAYNGGGAAQYGLQYSTPIQTMIQNAKSPQPINY